MNLESTNCVPLSDFFPLMQNAIANVTWLKVDLADPNRLWKSRKIRWKPGWYFIKTNVPISVLQAQPKPPGKRNIDIAKRITRNLNLYNSALTCPTDEEGNYIIYGGEANKLGGRICSHIYGGSGTGCLAIEKYDEFHEYNWHVACIYFSDIVDGPVDDAGLRVFIEQEVRNLIGWPLLCNK